MSKRTADEYEQGSMPGHTVRIHVDEKETEILKVGGGGVEGRRGSGGSNAGAGVEMQPMGGKANTGSLSRSTGTDGIVTNMQGVTSPADTASPDAGLFPGSAVFPISIANLQRLFATETTAQMVADIIGKEYGGISGLMQSLATEPTGLDADMCNAQSQSVTERIAMYGQNTLPVAEKKTFLDFCQDVLEDTMLRVLMVAACVSIVLGCVDDPHEGWFEGAAIWFAIILVTLVSAANNYQQQRQFSEVDVSKELDAVTVIRSGRQFSLDPTEILVGDLVALAAGQRIPADGIMVQVKGQSLKVNESSATGETGLVEKKLVSKPLLMSGTEVVSGSCVMLVVLVGINTSYGQTLASLVEEDRQTPLQKKLGRVAELIGLMGTGFAVATFVALVGYWIHKVTPGAPSNSEWSDLLDIGVVCISIVVVAVPEGLPLAVTVSLAYSMKAMLKDHILVRELAACETMGNATAVCSDKTGTLTQNRMTVLRVHIQQQPLERPPPREDLEPVTLRLLEQSIILNSAAWIEDEHVIMSQPPQDWKWKDGNQTEVALLSWLISYGFDVNASRLRHAPQLKATESFDSIKKYSSIVLEKTPEELAEEGAGAKPYRQFFKGAAEAIIANTNRQVNAQGTPIPLEGSGGAMHRELLETVSDFSRRGLRVIAFSYRDLDEIPKIKKSAEQEAAEAQEEKKEGETTTFSLVPVAADPGSPEAAAAAALKQEQELEDDTPPPITDAILIGMVGLSDPLRPTSYRSVRLCQRAGIVVRMVTGDHVETARFISRECGIWTSKQHLCMTGAEFRKMMAEEDMESKKMKVERLRVLARSSPQDKQVLVKFLQDQGQVVAATGDGTNDAPALKAADVGIAMFLSGTAVCKSAADLWLMDDNFASIVAAVVWGRCVFDNIRKFLAFQLTVNVVALILSLVGAITDHPLPLTTVQLLWINLIMDTAAAVALGTEQPRAEELLARKPKAPDGPLISKVMWFKIVMQGVYQLAILFWIMYAHESLVHGIETDSRVHKTFIFNTFTWCQLGNAFNARRVAPSLNVFQGIFNNAYFLAIIAAAMGMQVLMVEVFGSFANTTGQTWRMWLIALGFGFASWISGLMIYFLWELILKIKPDLGEDVSHVAAGDAFEGAHLLDHRYSFKRPDNAEESVRRAKSRNSFSHHAGVGIGASPLHAHEGLHSGAQQPSMGAPVAQLGNVVGTSAGIPVAIGGGSNSRLVSSMSARRATNPTSLNAAGGMGLIGTSSARRSGGTVSFQPVGSGGQAELEDLKAGGGHHQPHGELASDSGAAGGAGGAGGDGGGAGVPGGVSSSQMVASASWPRSVLGPNGEPVQEKALGSHAPKKDMGAGGVQVIEELDELI